MTEITIDGVDYSDRIIKPNGISINRASVDPGDFETVGSTAQVRLSNLDNAVPQAPYGSEPWLSCNIAKDGERLLTGHIDPSSYSIPSFSGDSRDDESVLSFQVVDRTIYEFLLLERTEYPRGPSGRLSVSRVQVLNNIGGYDLQNVTRLYDLLQWSLGGIPVSLDSTIGDIWLDYDEILKITRTATIPGTKRPGVTRGGTSNDYYQRHKYQSFGALILDLAALFMAHPFFEEGEQAVFSMKAKRHIVYPPKPIERYTYLGLESRQSREVGYVEDSIFDALGVRRSIYYKLSGNTVNGSWEKPLSREQGLTVTPSFSGTLTKDDWHTLTLRYTNPPVYFTRIHWEVSGARLDRVGDALRRVGYHRVRVPGWSFKPFQHVIVDGVGYRIVEADIDPVGEVSELIIEEAAIL